MEVREPALAYSSRKYTIDEYLALENAATEKHEYYRGEIFAMGGARLQHNIVSKNLLAMLDKLLEGGPCQPYNSDTRIHVERNTLFTYPDVSVICGPPQTLNNDEMTVLNPSVMFEVLSPTTMKYDRIEKVALYKDIPLLTEIVIIHPDMVMAEIHHKQNDGEWAYQTITDINSKLHIPSLKLEIPLRTVYKQTRISGQYPV